MPLRAGAGPNARGHLSVFRDRPEAVSCTAFRKLKLLRNNIQCCSTLSYIVIICNSKWKKKMFCAFTMGTAFRPMVRVLKRAISSHTSATNVVFRFSLHAWPIIGLIHLSTHEFVGISPLIFYLVQTPFQSLQSGTSEVKFPDTPASCYLFFV